MSLSNLRLIRETPDLLLYVVTTIFMLCFMAGLVVILRVFIWVVEKWFGIA